MTDLVLIVALGAAAAGFIQGLSGFGFSLTAMSIWAWFLDPKLAAVLAVAGGLTGQVVAALTVRRGWDLKTLTPFVLGGLAGLPIGIWLLPRLDLPLFKGLIGLVLVVLCPLMFFSARMPRWRRHRGADAIAGAVGGAMAGLGGFSGVVPTLWCTLQGFAKDTQRSVIQNFNLTMLAVTFAGYLASGLVERAMLPLLAVAVPAMLVPSLLGARVYLGMADATFRKVLLALLTASGVALLGSALPALAARWPGT